jgi:hypothetical protein
MVPERGFAITVMTNGNRGGELHSDVTKWALKHYFGIEEALPERLKLGASELAAYAGRYSAAASDFDLSVRDGELWLQMIPKGGFPNKDSKPSGPPPPPVRIMLGANDTLVALDPPFRNARGDILRAPDGSIAWIRFGSRIAKRQ